MSSHNETPAARSLDAKRRSEAQTRAVAAASRRRRLDVYHRALRATHTPEERAAVAARYNRVFASAPATVTLAS